MSSGRSSNSLLTVLPSSRVPRHYRPSSPCARGRVRSSTRRDARLSPRRAQSSPPAPPPPATFFSIGIGGVFGFGPLYLRCPGAISSIQSPSTSRLLGYPQRPSSSSPGSFHARGSARRRAASSLRCTSDRWRTCSRAPHRFSCTRSTSYAGRLSSDILTLRRCRRSYGRI